MQLTRDIKGQARQFAKFASVGVLGFGLYFAIYAGLLRVGVHYLAASWTGWFIALCVAFELNRRLVFRYRGAVLRAFLRSVLVYGLQQMVVIVALWICVERLLLDERLALLMAIPFAVCVSYFGLLLFAFARPASEDKSEDTAA